MTVALFIFLASCWFPTSPLGSPKSGDHGSESPFSIVIKTSKKRKFVGTWYFCAFGFIFSRRIYMIRLFVCGLSPFKLFLFSVSSISWEFFMWQSSHRIHLTSIYWPTNSQYHWTWTIRVGKLYHSHGSYGARRPFFRSATGFTVHLFFPALSWLSPWFGSLRAPSDFLNVDSATACEGEIPIGSMGMVDFTYMTGWFLW